MKNGRFMKVLVPAAIVLAALVLYRNVFKKSIDKLSDLQENETFAARSLARYERLALSIPPLTKRLEDMEKLKNARVAGLFSGLSLSETGAAVQEAVKNIVAANGGTISSEKTGAPKPLNGFTVVSASFDMTLPDTRSLVNILYQLKTHDPSLVVNKMEVRRANMNDPKTLTAGLTVEALAGFTAGQSPEGSFAAAPGETAAPWRAAGKGVYPFGTDGVK